MQKAKNLQTQKIFDPMGSRRTKNVRSRGAESPQRVTVAGPFNKNLTEKTESVYSAIDGQETIGSFNNFWDIP